jgi:adenosylhomocysteinase
METLETARVDSYFSQVISRYPVRQPLGLFVITHLLADRPWFVGALAKQAEVKAILPKPKSVDSRILREVGRTYVCDELTRERFQDPEMALEYLERHAAGESIVLLDVGGYFAPALRELTAAFSGKIEGLVEDTENGHRRYLALGDLPCPVYSVARSPLKESEDYLVGQSIVFSTEALLRSWGDLLQGGEACVIGFGKVGTSVARTLHAKNVRVGVYDESAVRMTHALAQGFQTFGTRAEALNRADLVVCATGNVSLRTEDFSNLRNGAYVVSVTSSEDELELAGLSDQYDRCMVGPHVTRYSTMYHYFYLVNNGNAVNFLHGAVVGPFIFLVQAEILAAVSLLAQGRGTRGLCEVGNDERAFIAQTWLGHFNR